MGVMLQAFYWDCPQAENREHQWWTFVKSQIASRLRKLVSLHCGFRPQTRQRAGNRWATTHTIITTSASLIRKAVCRRGSVPKPTC